MPTPETSTIKKQHAAPSYVWLSFKIALNFALFSVLFNVLNDCDEVYNYWEPLHFLVTSGKGGGFQTWEYSPVYGLRSFFYLWVFGWPAFIAVQLGSPTWLAFLFVRLHLALLCTLAVTILASVLHKLTTSHNQSAFGIPLPLLFVGFLCLSPGHFLYSTNLVPSGIAATVATFMLAMWLNGHFTLAVGCTAFMGIVLWPFAALLGLPLALHMLLIRRFTQLLASSIFWAVVFIVPMILVDSFYFGRVVLAPWNIVHYNVFSQATNVSGSASVLYGVEPASFYVKNYLLNFNLLVPLSCCFALFSLIYSLFILFSSRPGSREQVWNVPARTLPRRDIYMSCFLPLLTWNVVFFVQPHKEERFLYPCYPFMVLGAALLMWDMNQLVSNVRRCRNIGKYFCTIFSGITIVLFLLFSFSRIAALVRWYNAPVYLIRHLPTQVSDTKSILCLGRDWHYFPSRFLLPQGGEKWDVSYLPSNFSGQLPGQYKPVGSEARVVDSTRVDGSHFNVENLEEPDRFLSGGAERCDFIMDRDSTPGTREELYVAQSDKWTSVADRTILEPRSCKSDASGSLTEKYPYLCSLFRSFYIPYFSEVYNSPVRMHILQKVK
ncbi:alpha-1 2-mannosyltransferase [Clonorchis sinensis]|uniref:Mannosyltransferase n=1 Tax=Clonorchis sinensis TaxID=79923 RepID=G7YLD2_CLOSI|nr:alpha-1 2-mannosyltransferase [Clonorchis sinensis]